MTNQLTKRILVSDGDCVVPRLIEKAVEVLGSSAQVDSAKTKTDSLIKVKESRYDVIFIRNRLPEKREEDYPVTNSGLDLLKTIRDGTINKETPVFLMSGACGPLFEKLKEYNAKGIQLPFEYGELPDLLKEYI